MKQHYFLIPVGSSGDVHPLIGLGIGLKARGHDVSVMTNGYFRPLVDKNGLRYVEFGTAENYIQMTSDPDIWHPVKGPKVVFNSLAMAYLQPAYEMIEQEYARSPFTMVGAPLCFAARCAQEKRGIPLISTNLQPLIFRSRCEVPAFPGVSLPDWTPSAFLDFVYWYADTVLLEPLFLPRLNAFRAELGLKPVKRVMDTWWNSPTGVLGLWPEWFGPPQRDWPPNVHLAGFPLYDERSVMALTPELEAFLGAGAPPIAFTPGSAMQQGKFFFEAAADACRRLGRRGVLLSRFKHNIPERLPEGVIHCEYAPFSLLLPRAAALVHHGGVGTMAQGFQAGVPQLIMPLAHDQADNAKRLRKLGCGASLAREKFTGPNVAKALRPLLGNQKMTAACRVIAERIAGERSLDRACDIVEFLSDVPKQIASAGAAAV